MQTEISCFASFNDKSTQTEDVPHDAKDDAPHDVRPREPLSDEKFSEFEPKTRQKSDKSGQKSIYTYFASLSPLNKRSVANSSSSLSSVCRPVSSGVVSHSPDLGIETEFDSGNGNRVWISLKDFRKLRNCLLEALNAINDQNIRELIHNCVNICEKFCTKSDENNENLKKKLEKMRKSKENMEKAIQKQLNKTNELLIKTKENL